MSRMELLMRAKFVWLSRHTGLSALLVPGSVGIRLSFSMTPRMPRIPREVLMDVVSCLTRYEISECHLVSSEFHHFLDDVSSPYGRKLQGEYPEVEAILVLNQAVRFSFVREIEVHGATLTYALCAGIANAISTVTVGNLSFYAKHKPVSIDSKTFQNFLLGFARIKNLLHLSGVYRAADVDDDFMRRCVQKGILRIQRQRLCG
ncbi:hypothetical protein AAVH_31664 [Aphelenchoides avenae]|nr:hypothetical protein AAVH_31664 [Aphelenchus avenae]